jgi:hypothetical protein
MPPSGDKAAQERLGRLLRQARVQQALKYKNRALFAREKGINERLLQDAETAYRGGFSDDTKLALELAYGWEPGSFDRVLAGGEPVAGTAPEDAALDLIIRAWGSLAGAPERIQRVWSSRYLTLDEKLLVIERVIRGSRNPGNPGEEHELRRA